MTVVMICGLSFLHLQGHGGLGNSTHDSGHDLWSVFLTGLCMQQHT